MKSRAPEWRPLIEKTVAMLWPGLPNGAFWIEAQLDQESAGIPDARSSVGALGLMQLMPETARELGLVVEKDKDERLNPVRNVWGGVLYLRQQYEHMGEIPLDPDRLYWSFASFNGGRGFVNMALALARQAGEHGPWWSWAASSPFLGDPRCTVKGMRGQPLHCDFRQMQDYVAKIIRNYSTLVAPAGDA